MVEEVFWESYSLGDDSQEKSGQTWPILKGSTEIGTYIRDEWNDHLDTPEGEWVIDASANYRVSATLPGGHVFSTVAASRDKISRAKQLPVAFRPNRPEGKLVYERSTNYIIENAKTDKKWGQFTDASRGVRHTKVQFDTDEGRALPEEGKISLVYSARRALESHMVSST